MDFPCSMVSSTKKLCTLLFLFCMLLSPLLYLSQSLYPFFHTKTLDIPLEINSGTDNSTDPCIGRYIYVYHLPKQFNSQILDGCHNLCLWYDMCELIVNSGLGPELDNNDGVLQETGWYFTHQYVLEIIFHNRMKQYECLTTNYSMASAVFVPYYSGLDIMRYLWDTSTDQKSRIDKLAVELVDWLRKRSEWAAKSGKDHFIVSGRPTSDFQRDEVSSWGSKFLNIPEMKNMIVLSVERKIQDNNEFAIPYPTYLHPLNNSQVVTWQLKMRSQERPWLFSFAAGRRPNMPHLVRNHLFDQCAQSSRCKLHECKIDRHECNSPSNLTKMFMQSKFCLQPQGDTLTRRSTFDSMIAGCIPVFFHNGTAELQYKWYFPRKFSKFSVFISEDAVKAGLVRVEDVLLRYSDEETEVMREEVIRTIPDLVYKDPRYVSEDLKDAFDVAVNGVLDRVRETC